LGIGDWGFGIGVLGVGAITQNPKHQNQNQKKNILIKFKI